MTHLFGRRRTLPGVGVLGLLAAALVPSPAHADARVEARRHFRTGMELIAQGAYEQGITELSQAYSIRPHPNVLFNIARAYQDEGRIPEAILYFRRYLATRPPDADAVAPILGRLESSLPAREERKRPPPPPPPPPDRSAATRQETVRRLNERVAQLEAALAKAQEEAARRPKEPEPKPPERSANPEIDAAFEEGNAGNTAAPYEEQVSIASRRAQSTLEAANATTVITRDEIRQSGVRSLVELLRRVPGADVMELGVGSADVSFRGFNQRLANKVLVLLDGRTLYEDFFGATVWPEVPIELEEIERIEVIRGPGSALYGADAMLGVINIITRTPGKGARAEVTGLAGSGNTLSGGIVAHGGADGFAYRASAGYLQADKWSRDFDSSRPDVAPAVDPNLGLRTTKGNVDLAYNFTPDVQWSASAGLSRFFSELYSEGVLRNFYLDAFHNYVKTDLTGGAFKLKLFWNHLQGTAGPQYEPIGARSLQTQVESNVFDAEALVSPEFDLLGHHHFSLGASARLKRVSLSYLDALHSELHAAAFAQDEWKVFNPIRIVGSFRVDRLPVVNNGNPGYAASPQVALLFLPAAGQSLRVSYSTAFREPTFLENYNSLRLPLPGVNGASFLSSGSLALQPESIRAYELGYRGEAPKAGLEWDLALYQNEVDKLIDLSAPVATGAQNAFDPVSQTYLIAQSRFQNEGARYTARGAEAGLTFSPVDGLDMRLSTAFEAIAAAGLSTGEPCVPCGTTPALKLYGTLSYRAPFGLELGTELGYVSGTTWIEREPSSADPTSVVSTSYPLAGYAVVNARAAMQVVKDHLTVSLLGSQLATHREHPFGNLITPRVYLMLTVTP